MNNTMESAAHLKPELTSIRRTLHRHPEVGRSLPQTKALVIDKLKEYGYEPLEICESGISAVINGPKEGKTILLRADMDALSIKEKSQLPFASTNDAMHACGHDMHTTMLLGAAKLLRQYQDEIKGTVKLVFQPGFLTPQSPESLARLIFLRQIEFYVLRTTVLCCII